MCKKILLLSAMTCLIAMVQAQSKKSTTAYAITSPQKGQNGWKEVRLIDLKTGDELQTVYKSGQEVEILNARTGKAVQKRDELAKTEEKQTDNIQVFALDANNKAQVISSKEEMEKKKAAGNRIVVIRNNQFNQKPQYDKPFATNSAALAYDKKHERLYYTPMGINQLRYIDLKAKTAKIYYFEDEAFGTVKNQSDGAGQIARMVIAGDGNGYALSNDANHLMRFSTGKKPEITDLGAVSEVGANDRMSIHRGVGGDLIADNAGNLYLITAYRNVFKINIETKISTYLGAIKGLPDAYQTNGAVVEEGTKIIVCSATSTEGYYRFDLNTLQSEKISGEGQFYNASDLANSNLLVVDEKKKEEKPKEVVAPVVVAPVTPETSLAESLKTNNILVYPNPVTDGLVKLVFNNQPAGKYNVQVLDMNGKMMMSQDVTINSKSQVQEIKLPASIAKGNYLVKVTGAGIDASVVTKLAVQ